jgi:hypothetical protein
VCLSFIEESVGLPSQEILCLRGIHIFSPTILHYVIKFVNDLRQVVGFRPTDSSIKLRHTISWLGRPTDSSIKLRHTISWLGRPTDCRSTKPRNCVS